ncbi:MAG: hypothetical protein K2O65_09240 [Lachnospiraceae bacterium]|nr:hypothetical protein [Lachnospiraceae bacterium]
MGREGRLAQAICAGLGEEDMDKNEREKELLYQWGSEKKTQDRDIFLQPDKQIDSYFVFRTPSKYIREYGFETVPELERELDSMWGNQPYIQEIKKAVLVAAIKNKPRKMEEAIKADLEKEEKPVKEKMPAYIYNF